jgi:hypothetical protein
LDFVAGLKEVYGMGEKKVVPAKENTGEKKKEKKREDFFSFFFFKKKIKQLGHMYSNTRAQVAMSIEVHAANC